MRFVVELTDGVTTQVGLTGGTGAATTSFPQPLSQVKDILQANGIDLGLTFYSVVLANNTSSPLKTARLYFETSMQNEDATDSLWEKIGDTNGLDLAEETSGLPKQYVMSVTDDIGRYLRWRIEVDGADPAIILTAIFKITVLGRG